MKKIKKIAWIVLSLVLCSSPAFAKDFTLSSPQLKDGASMEMTQVFNSFGCSGENVSPELHWKNAPKGTKSFAITMYDPDAPTGSGWWHWVMFNIPANVNSISLGAGTDMSKLPKGTVSSVTDFGAPGYGGACPPEGDKAHRYIVKIVALGVDTLNLDANAMPAYVGFNVNSAKLGEATIEVKYAR